MSEPKKREITVAIITAIGSIIVAIITGIFLLLSKQDIKILSQVNEADIENIKSSAEQEISNLNEEYESELAQAKVEEYSKGLVDGQANLEKLQAEEHSKGYSEGYENGFSDGGNATIKPLSTEGTTIEPLPIEGAIEIKTYEGRIEESGNVNTYDFELLYSARVTMDFEHGFVDYEGYYWTIQFMSKNGVEAEFDSKGDAVTEKSPHAMYLPAGDYTIRIKQNSWYSNADYKIKIIYEKNIGQFEYEPNDTMETAAPIEFDKPIKGNSMSNKDIDYYKLTVTSKQEISLKFTHGFIDYGGFYWTIDLISPNNGILISFNSEGNVMEKISKKITLIDAGDYYIKIKPDSWHSKADYTIVIVE